MHVDQLRKIGRCGCIVPRTMQYLPRQSCCPFIHLTSMTKLTPVNSSHATSEIFGRYQRRGLGRWVGGIHHVQIGRPFAEIALSGGIALIRD